MRHETWIISEPRNLRTTIAANAADAAAANAAMGFGAGDGPVAAVTVSLMAGSVRVETHERLDIELDVVTVTGRPLVAELEGDAFIVSYDHTGLEGVVGRVRGINDKDSANIVLRVPRTTAVKVSTVRADVAIEDLTGAVTVNTVDGAVEVASVTGILAVSTAAGRVSVTHHTGPVKANTVAGDVHLAGDLGRVDVNSVSGEVVVVVGSGASKVSVKTVSSRVSLRAPVDTGVDLQARTVTAAVSVDGMRLAARRGPAKIEHTQPGAVVFFSANTVTGDIDVTHEVS